MTVSRQDTKKSLRSENDDKVGEVESEAEPGTHGTIEHALSTADSFVEDISEIDPDEMGADGANYKTLIQRKANLMKTSKILAVHDVVVQKLINKARDDLGKIRIYFTTIFSWNTAQSVFHSHM